MMHPHEDGNRLEVDRAAVNKWAFESDEPRVGAQCNGLKVEPAETGSISDKRLDTPPRNALTRLAELTSEIRRQDGSRHRNKKPRLRAQGGAGSSTPELIFRYRTRWVVVG